MSGRILFCALGGALLFACSAGPSYSVPSVPAQFVVEDVAPGAGLNTPVGLAFFPGGRMLVAEKRGRVYTVKNGVKSANPLWQSENEVLNNGDRGLLGVAVDPRYNGTTNRWIYLLYTVDPDSNGSDTNDDAFGRLIRVQVSASDSNTVDYASRQVLMGVNWRNGPVSASTSHTIGTLRFARDGSLIVSCGDGAQFNAMDAGGVDAGAFGTTKTDPLENIGAFRSQYINSLAGKILRINPDNGQGYSSNPYWDGNGGSVRSRVWAYGVRNTYRFCVKPGSGSTNAADGNPGSIYMGEVGWTTWEETNIARTGGLNFGWPCYEGFGPQSEYQAASPARAGCGTLGTADNPATQVAAPNAAWHHSNDALSVPSGFHGNTSIGGAFYTAARYPSQFRNQYFFGDYGQSWVKVAVMDANDQLVQILPFGTAMDGPVDFNVDPVTGDILYVAINVGQVRRIRWTGAVGGNTPPVASISANPPSGPAPLTVNFSGAGSTDADGDPLTYAWLFGDGTGASGVTASHTYATTGTYTAQLTVTDPSNGQGVSTASILVGGAAGSFPSTPVVDNFNRANGAIGGAWGGDVSGLFINANQLSQTCCSPAAVWNGAVFGPDQEAYLTFSAVTPTADEEDLMLKVQGTTYASGYIEVRYWAGGNQVIVTTYTSATGWVLRGSPIAVTFAAGDQFGARAMADGSVTVFKNGAQIGAVSVGNWPYAANGGRIGFIPNNASASRWDNFGGGNVVTSTNTKPTASIQQPANNSFFYTGQTVNLLGSGSDSQTPPASLGYQWILDLHHNTHTHPAVLTLQGTSNSFVAENHDDGTGVYYEVKFVVTDAGGLTDTARVNIYPEVDLTPSSILVTPAAPVAGGTTNYSFKLRNLGRNPAPRSRWVLRAGNAFIAQGDTLVAPNDSVGISINAASLAAGPYTLRVKLDSLATVLETNESNNASVATLTVAPNPANRAPVAVASGAPLTGTAPLVVNFSSAGSSDPDGNPLTFAWAFGDGGTSNAPSPPHTYAAAGAYVAILTVSDGAGGSDTASVNVTVSAPVVTFPANAVLDNFDRANGPIGKNWENSSGFSVNSLKLKPSNGTPNATWVASAFGVNQEVFITMSTVSATAPEHILWLKVQSHHWYSGHIEIDYLAQSNLVAVNTYDPQTGWQGRGTFPVTFVNGDRFGARALANGNVTVYRNGVALGTASVAGWRFAANGGFIGMSFAGAGASVLDDFGGGNAPASSAPAVAATHAEKPWVEAALPAAIALSAPRPNPSRGAFSMAIELPRETNVQLSVLDVQGRIVWREPARKFAAGRQSLEWSGRTESEMAPVGIYLLRVRVGPETFTKRAALVR